MLDKTKSLFKHLITVSQEKSRTNDIIISSHSHLSANRNIAKAEEKSVTVNNEMKWQINFHNLAHLLPIQLEMFSRTPRRLLSHIFAKPKGLEAKNTFEQILFSFQFHSSSGKLSVYLKSSQVTVPGAFHKFCM